MTEKKPFDLADLDPVDTQQQEILARIPVERRHWAMMEASEWMMAGLRGAFRRRFPNASQREINLRALAWATPLRGVTLEELLSREHDRVLSGSGASVE